MVNTCNLFLFSINTGFNFCFRFILLTLLDSVSEIVTTYLHHFNSAIVSHKDSS